MAVEQYHPRKKRNEILDANEIELILTEGKYISLALCFKDEPYIVSLSYGYDAQNNCLYFHCAAQGDKLMFIRQNPRVCGTIILDKGYLMNQCDHDYASLVIRGTMHEVLELSEKKHGLAVLLEHLEDNPEPILKRNIADDSSYNGVTILRFDMDSVIGKKHV